MPDGSEQQLSRLQIAAWLGAILDAHGENVCAYDELGARLVVRCILSGNLMTPDEFGEAIHDR